ncbi:MAG: hypothetical protein QOG59_2227 [Solirubrobacteraceae bacterium]|jgi:hypothetical protein|nr:hypothetical protein [Solirubrobacteraceae bacterium]
MRGDWKDFRPAIWLAMIGIALVLVLNPYVGAAVLGAAIGIALKVERGHRGLPAGSWPGRRRRRP